eukprot:6187007-Alexandrium_andersonii.AAC.1
MCIRDSPGCGVRGGSFGSLCRPAPNTFRQTRNRRCKRLQHFSAVCSGLLRSLPRVATAPPDPP